MCVYPLKVYFFKSCVLFVLLYFSVPGHACPAVTGWVRTGIGWVRTGIGRLGQG